MKWHTAYGDRKKRLGKRFFFYIKQAHYWGIVGFSALFCNKADERSD